MEKIYLAACPFCAGLAKKIDYDPYDGYQGNNTVYRVRCCNCGAEVRANSRDEAIRKWNRRASAIACRTSAICGSSISQTPIYDNDLHIIECPIPDLIDLQIKKMWEAYLQNHQEEVNNER